VLREENAMYKRILAILVASVLVLALFTGCGAKKESGGMTAAAQSVSIKNASKFDAASIAADESADYGSMEAPREVDGEESGAPGSIGGGGNVLDMVNNAILAERKIIRSANISIEVDNFDEALNDIYTIINGIGIVQDLNVTTDKIYVEGEYKPLKSGTIVLRVYKEKFDSVLNNLKGIGEVTNETISGQDVTDRFIDIESRLRLLKMEQEKLEAHLARLNNVDEIFKAESRLTEIRYEIESLTSNLNRINSLVELSTITISMREKNPYEEQKPPVKKTYWDRVLDRLKSSFEGVVVFLGEVILFIIAAIPVLLMLGLFCLLIWAIYGKIRKKRRIPHEPVQAAVQPPMTNADAQNRKDEEQ